MPNTSKGTGMKKHAMNLTELKQLIQDGRDAMQYAWDHYEELVAREAVHILYGPSDYGIGAGIPGKFIPERSRKLLKKTRRKDYIIYELDSEYKLLRTTTMRDYTTAAYVYHCFETNGMQYACAFHSDKKKIYFDEVLAVKHKNGLPCFLGFLRARSLIAEYYEYTVENKASVTAYSYAPFTVIKVNGCTVDPDAPIGAVNSAVEMGRWEIEMNYTDFSRYFKPKAGSVS